MQFRRYITPLAVAAGLALPATASARVHVAAGYEQVTFDVPAGQCITVDVKLRGSKTWKPVTEPSTECVSSHSFDSPHTPARNGTTYYKYRVTKVVMSGGGQPTVAAPVGDPVLWNWSCVDGIDNDSDGMVDEEDQDFSDEADVLNSCDRGVAPIVATPTTVIKTGWIRVKTIRYAAERTYQYVNGRYNDDFFNRCIKGGKELYSVDHGNFYCISDPAFIVHKIALKAP